ncbi:MAG: hypothetical protein BGO31_03890 [Bacteroidetes bacterium 43-16]|nr:MAG: hypothetical protein BGO31_03890 [Bacteroidetes bacterium 43-16]
MNKLIKISAILVTSLGIMMFHSCKPKPIDPTNEGIGELLPINVDNWWQYEASDSTIFRRYYTGRDTTIDNFNYNYFEQVNVNSGTIVKEFYAKFEGNYYTLVKIDDAGNTFVKAQVLNGDPKLGDTWENTATVQYSTLTFYAKTEGEIISVTDTITVNGALLDNVIVSKTKLYARFSPFDNWAECGTMIMKFKRGTGIIGEDYDFQVPGFVDKTYSNHLVNYHIVP